MAEYYERQFPESFSLLDKISYLQRAILMASITYYDMNTNVMSDYAYDGISRQVLRLTQSCPNPEDSQYWYVFKDFDGNTGFDLKSRLTEEDRDYLTRLAVCALSAPARPEPKPVTTVKEPAVSLTTDLDGQMSFF